MALSDAARATLAADVAARIAGTVLGREASGGAVETAIARAAVDYCDDAAPRAPEAILREACVRFAAWMYGNRPHVREQETEDASGTRVRLAFDNTRATANGFRASGAAALLSRYIVRRGGAIGTAAETPSGAGTTPAGGGEDDTANGGTSPTVRVALVEFRNPGAVFSDLAAMTAQAMFDAGTRADGASERAVSVAAPVRCHQQRTALAAAGFQWLTVAVPEGTDTPSHFRLSDAVPADDWRDRWRLATGTAVSRGTNYSVHWWPQVQTAFPAILTVEWPLA